MLSKLGAPLITHLAEWNLIYLAYSKALSRNKLNSDYVLSQLL